MNSALCARTEFDRLERVTRTKSSGNLAEYTFAYDAAGNLSVVGGPAGTLVTYETDDFGNVVTVTGQWANGSTRQRFDAAGRLRERRTPSLAAPERQEYQYDALGRPTKALLASAGTVLWQMGYDGSTAAWTNCPPAGVTQKGKVQWKDDSFGRTWYRYDAMGNVLELKRVRAGATSCAASASSTDANPDTTFTYDSLQRLSTMKYPHGLNVMYEYGDALGRPHEVTGIKVNSGSGWVQLVPPRLLLGQ